MANQTYAVTAKSCNKLLIGKTYCKSVALPNILFGAILVHLTKTDIEGLQRTEISANGTIIGASKSYPVSGIREKVRSSLMSSKIMGGKLQCMQGTMKGEANEIVRDIIDIYKEEPKNK